jgi:hydrogenase maturation protease
MSMSQPKVVILGIGNLLLGDEGVGVHAVRLLRSQCSDRVEVETIDGGTSPELCSLLDRKLDKLIILDAVRGNKPPGTLYRLSIDDINLSSPRAFSLHELSLVESIQQLELLGRRPREIVIIGMEPQIIDWSLGLSLAVKEKLLEMVDLAIREADVLC